MWTRLLYMNLNTAFKPTLVNGKWHSPLISARYKNKLKQQFRTAGVPWNYETKVEKPNPRHKTPKGHRYEKERPIRLAKIKQSLTEQENMALQYRQAAINKRKLAGFDFWIQKAIPSFLSQRQTADDKFEENAVLLDGPTKSTNKYKKDKKELKYIQGDDFTQKPRQVAETEEDRILAAQIAAEELKEADILKE